MKHVDLVIRNGLCISSRQAIRQDIAVQDGMIVEVGVNLNCQGEQEIDASNYHVLPGVIDSQVHFREPGLEHKEDLHTGSLAAAYGGVTTFLEMPNTHPATTTCESIADKVQRGRGRCYSDYGFFIGATEENLDELIKAQNREGVAGIKIFLGSSTGSLLLNEERALKAIFEKTTTTISVHSENEVILEARKSIRDEAHSAHAHPDWRNVESAYSSTYNILKLARSVGRKLHILHVSTKEEMELLAQNKDICTVEVTPQHLTLAAPDCYDRLGTYAQMNPPIREDRHRQGLWTGIREGIVDVIGSDHAPHTKEEKERGYPHSPSGMPGVQTMLGVMLSHVEAQRLGLQDVVRLLCEKPAELFGLTQKGRLEVGHQADINLIDFNQRTTITHEEMRSRVGWTPFHGLSYSGQLVCTFLRGRPILEAPNGRPIQR